MKKIIFRSLFAVILFTSVATVSNAQRIYVKVQPTATVVARPPQPSPRHVWVEGDWVIENGAYVHHEGYWTVPPQGKIWVSGRWAREGGGYYWVAGHWRRA